MYAKASTKCPYSTLENFHHIYDQNDQRYLKISDKNGYLVYSLIIQYNIRASSHTALNNATTSKTHLQCQISIQNQSPDFRQIHDKNYVFISWNIKPQSLHKVIGGANRDRTDDLKLAKLALSQLSYGPLVLKPISAMVHSFECFPEMKGSEDGVL